MSRNRLISDEDLSTALAAYRALNDSPIQRRLRDQKQWFAGVVFWSLGDNSREKLLYEFRRILSLGFNAVRFHSLEPDEITPGVFDFSRADQWMDVAVEAGIRVILHIDPRQVPASILDKHGLTSHEYTRSQPEDPRALAAIRETAALMIERYRNHPALLCWGTLGEPGPGDRDMTWPEEQRAFGEWLQAKYGNLEALDRAWNIYPRAGQWIVSSFDQAWRLATWNSEHMEGEGLYPVQQRNYGARRDLMRYQTEKTLIRARAVMANMRALDPEHVFQTGMHQVFSNQAQLRWDQSEWARLADLNTISIHMSWHFELVDGEVDRPVYMQSRFVRDTFKDAWTSAYETTGGAVQYSGGYGNAMTPGLVRRLMLNYLAAGNLNIAFWTWNHRPGGWEAGEYGLTTLSGAVSSWAEEAGQVARAMSRYADELWVADNQTQVGILYNWDTDAILELEPERHELRHSGPNDYTTGTRQSASRARIGASRALINQRIPFEYVSEAELLTGIALCYPTIYVPHLRAASDELLAVLANYIEKGGRLVADVQFAFEDPWGKVRVTGKGNWQERLFGAYVDTIHDARTARRTVNGLDISGFWADIRTTDAKILAWFDDERPAITEVQRGKGSAVLIGFDSGMLCYRPGQESAEGLIGSLMWNAGSRANWESDASMAFRRCAPKADHYFMMNDGPARTAILKVYDTVYLRGEYVIEQQPLDCSGTISVKLPAESAIWIRFEKA